MYQRLRGGRDLTSEGSELNKLRDGYGDGCGDDGGGAHVEGGGRERAGGAGGKVKNGAAECKNRGEMTDPDPAC